MRETLGHVQHSAIRGGKFNGEPLLVTSGNGAKVHDHIINCARRAPDQLGLLVRLALIMQSTQGFLLLIERNVALHKVCVQALALKFLATPASCKEPAIVGDGLDID